MAPRKNSACTWHRTPEANVGSSKAGFSIQGGGLRVGGRKSWGCFASSRLRCQSADLFPERNLRRLGNQLADPRQHGLQIGLLQVLIEVCFAGPVFVKEEERGVVRRLVQVVIKAPGILAAGGQQREQFLPDQASLARLGFELCDHSKRFCGHRGQSSRQRALPGNALLAPANPQRDRAWSRRAPGRPPNAPAVVLDSGLATGRRLS